MKLKLYPYRFEIFLLSQLLILFGALLFGPKLYDQWINPFVFQLNFALALIFLKKKRKIRNFMIFLVISTGVLIGSFILSDLSNNVVWTIRAFIYLMFYLVVMLEIVSQVWKLKEIGLKALFGMISGYISIGLIGYFFLTLVYLQDAEAFSNLELVDHTGMTFVKERLMYFSFITLLTIGYGDIVPQTLMAQKLTVLIGLAGQLYLTIITAIVVGKFLSQASKKLN